MKQLLLITFCLLLSLSSFCKNENKQRINLAGKWSFALDRKDVGISENWYKKKFDQTIQLPGSLQKQGYGDNVGVNTPWTGQIVDRSWYNDSAYAKYRKEGNIKIPFWLNPDKHYVGVAWYQKEVDIPENWKEQTVSLNLERPHWETTLFIDGEKIGSENSLGVPHRYEIKELKAGKHLMTIRLDNRMVVEVGMNSHSVSDHTQSNWNGIVGDISLEAKPLISIDDIVIQSHIAKKEIAVRLKIFNRSNKRKKVKVNFFADALNHNGKSFSSNENKTILAPGLNEYTTTLFMGENPMLWDEYTPNLYELNVSIVGDKIETKRKETFGIRELSIKGKRFTINDLPIFLRGTLECAIFPYTGYPPTDDAYWEKIYKAVKDHGLNHVRFHSWCPPKAAFRVADRVGIYLQVECNSWANTGASIGDGKPTDKWIYDEGDKIIKEYGNHPSFCMLAYGNEPAGNNQVKYLTDLIEHWRKIDGQRLYTSSGGWPYIESADFYNSPNPRIQGWGQGLNSIINGESPRTDYDFQKLIQDIKTPTVSHEIGQWCVYPNFKEIHKYTGVLKAKNFEIFEETLDKNNLSRFSEQFLIASGKLQALCYKADIEAALRTPEFAGFQLLDLHDFPGQGSALVGVLDVFWESKGYITSDEYRRFCNRTVPLARMEKLTWKANETFKASIEISHFEKEASKNVKVLWRITDKYGKIYKEGNFVSSLPITNCIEIGEISFPLNQFTKAEQLKLSVSIPEKNAENDWHFWVYPAIDIDTDNIFVTETFNDKAKNILKKGGKVMLSLKKNSIKSEKGGDIKVGFSSIFWNTAWTAKQAPHTLGILCNPEHNALAKFPTTYHSDYQWWDIMSNCNAMILDSLPIGFDPIIRVIDDWFTNRSLGLAFEAKIGEGKLLVTSIDFYNNIENRPSAKQLKYSLIEYIKSKAFDPQTALENKQIEAFLKEDFKKSNTK